MITDRRLVLDWTRAHDVVPLERQLSEMLSQLLTAKRAVLRERTTSRAAARDADDPFRGLIPERSPELEAEIQRFADAVRAHSDALVVIAASPDALGAKALYEALTHSHAVVSPRDLHRRPVLFFTGATLATDEIADLIDALEVFSPSLLIVGEAELRIETSVAFRVFRQYLEERFGAAEARLRTFVATTREASEEDARDSASTREVSALDPSSPVQSPLLLPTLARLAREQGYRTFTRPATHQGVYGLFSSATLLPLAVAGIDIGEWLEGATLAADDAASERNESLETNLALCYAGLRACLAANRFKAESLCTWSPKLALLGAWWAQFHGATDVKEGTGLLPFTSNFSSELNARTSFFQDGEHFVFATHVRALDECAQGRAGIKRRIKVPPLTSTTNPARDYLAHAEVSTILDRAQLATMLTHADSGVPTLVWELPEISPYWLGYWMTTNMIACVIGAALRGVNPLTQPAFDVCRNNMGALLGDPAQAGRGHEMRARLERSQGRLKSFGLTTRGGLS